MDVLAGAGEAAGPAIRALQSGGLLPLVLAPRGAAESARPETSGARQVVGSFRPAEGAPESGDILLRAAEMARAPLGETFLICADPTEAQSGLDHDCRVVLVLGGRTLEEALGPGESEHKSMSVAADLDAAVHYALVESAEASALGPFPFTHPVLDERPRRVGPSTGDLVKLFALVVVAGIAVALGITFLLRELYQTYHFPPIAYWLTLQFIPQTWRGVIFLLVGVAIGISLYRVAVRLRGDR